MKQNKLFYTLLLALFLPLAAKNNCNTDCKVNCKPCSTQSIDCINPIVDYVIIGLGTAGATLARYLSDQIDGEYKNNVLVLEAGSRVVDDLVLQPTVFGTGPLAVGTKYSNTWSALLGPEVNVGFAGFLYTEGRMWGGSSGHNGLIAVRGSSEIYDDWATLTGNSQWSYTNLLPVMKFMEGYTPMGTTVDTSERGTTGPLRITQDDYSAIPGNGFNMALSTASNTPIVEDYNATNTGISSNQLYITPPPGSERSWSYNAFLPDTVVTDQGFGVDGRKLRIVSQATASHLIFDQSGSTPIATGVEYILDGNREQVRHVYARKKIILCAGAVENVGILQRSGVGDATLLGGLGIDVVVDSPTVGKNLQNHYGTSCIMTATNMGSPAPSQLVEAFIDLSPEFPADGIRRNQILYSQGPFLFGSFAALRAIGYEPFEHFTDSNSFGPTIVKPGSRGTVMIADTDPLTNLIVNFNFYSDGTVFDPTSDASQIIAALKIIRSAATSLGEEMVYPTPAMYAADPLLYVAAQDVPFITYHAAGTCAMGTSIANGVVDGNLHVFGVSNLMCADCSIEPTIQTGNTAYAAYVIGAVAARICGSQTVPALP